MAPARTIYVKDADIPVWERCERAVKEWQVADSVSALITGALRQFFSQFGDQGGGLYVEAPDGESATFDNGITAIMTRHGRNWMLHLDEAVHHPDAENPYHLSFHALKDAVAESREVMARQRAGTEIMVAARRLGITGEDQGAVAEREGREAGRQWALKRATKAELDFVLTTNHEWWMSIDPPSDPASMPTLHRELAPHVLPDDFDAGQPWRIEREPFTAGFFEAAAETYEEIRETEKAL